MKNILLITFIAIGVIGISTGLFFFLKYQGFFEYQWSRMTSEEISGYEQELVALSKTDPQQALIRFKEILQENPLSYNSCHGLAHQMGHETYEAFGFSEAMEVANALCGGGYIHGIIEAKFGYLKEDQLFEEVQAICAEDDLTCAHGIGHGLMIATDLDIKTSLSYCDSLTGLSIRNCYDGVWMHIFDLEESGAREKGPKAFDSNIIDDMEELCHSSENKYKTSCYFYLPRIFAHFDEVPFSNQVQLCTSVETEYQLTCAAGSGHSNMKYHISDPATSLLSCDLYPKETLMQACKEGSLIYYLYSQETTAEGEIDLEALCEDFDEEYASVCKKVLGYRSEL